MSEKVENSPVEKEQDLSELLQIRRDKLAALQDKGEDPFEITVRHPYVHAAEIVERF